MGKQWKERQTLFSWAPKITVDGDNSRKVKRHLLLGRKAMTNLDSVFKQRHHFADKGPYSQSYSFSNSHIWMWELDHKKGWELKNWCFQNVVLEKTLESPLDIKEIKQVNPGGNQPWIFIGRNDAEAETPIFWPPNVKRQLIGKDPYAGKDWGQEEKETPEDQVVGWTWVWTNSGRQRRTGKPGVLHSMGSQRVRHDWLAEQRQNHVQALFFLLEPFNLIRVTCSRM